MKNSLLRNMTMASTKMKYLLLFSFWLISLTQSATAQESELICQQAEDSVKIITCSGSLPAFTYKEPYFNDYVFNTADVVRIEGPASGSLFPIGTTRVTYVATWVCDPILESTVMCTDTCTFTVTVEEGIGVMFYADRDRDHRGDPNSPDNFFGCPFEKHPGFSTVPDCNDSDPSVWESFTIYADLDEDGYTTQYGTICVGEEWPSGVPLPGIDYGYFFTPLKGEDCNDSDSTIKGKEYFYLDLDNDGYPNEYATRVLPLSRTILLCSAQAGIETPYKLESELKSIQIDCDDRNPLEHPDQSWFLDNDGDHYGQGVGGEIRLACTRPPGNWFASSELNSEIDCDDGDATITTIVIWCLDADKDGYYTGDPVVAQCASPGPGYVKKNAQKPGDCNDNDETINPETIWYVDSDNDGYYLVHPLFTYSPSCSPPSPLFNTTSTKGPDCNDNDSTINPETLWYLDVDNDGYYVTYTTSCTPPGPFFTLLSNKGPDCNDNDSTINPETVWYLDADNDGYHDPFYLASISCTRPGQNFKNSTKGVDCNDANKLQNPETIWILDKDGDSFYTDEQQSCFIVPGYQIKTDQQEGDCNDDDPDIHTSIQYYVDGDKDGYGSATTAMLCSSVAPVGYSTNNTDCNDNNGTINPATVWIKDIDLDGYYANIVTQCTSAGSGFVIKTTQLPGDCNDNNASVNPGAVEVCGNKIDDNCNGFVDETSCYSCQNGTNLTTTMVTSTSAQLNWVAIANPVYWQIQYKTTKPGSRWVDVNPDVTGNKRSVQIPGLAAKVNYLWHIKARCGNSWTDYSVSVPFTTLASGTTQKRSAETPEKTIVSSTDAFDIQATPNPSQQSFRIVIGTSILNEPVKLIVTDILGRVVETKTTHTGQIITIGENYRSGLYLIQAMLGKEQKQLKLIKL